MDAASQRRFAVNEAMFREANEGIERGLWPGEEDKRVPFRCECALVGCAAPVEMTPVEYEHVRSNPRWFVVVAGHEAPGAERVVERHPAYLVVEKVQAAAAVAEELDPRS